MPIVVSPPDPPQDPEKTLRSEGVERRIPASRWQQVKHGLRNPRDVGNLLRPILLDVWRSRGGGFYGLGYIVAFIYIEIEMIVSDFVDNDLGEFAAEQIVETFFRLGFMSFINALKALLWPLEVATLWGGAGVALLLAGFLLFEKVMRPHIERALPELAQHRADLEAKKSRVQAKKASKTAKRSARRARRAGRRAPRE